MDGSKRPAKRGLIMVGGGQICGGGLVTKWIYGRGVAYVAGVGGRWWCRICGGRIWWQG